MKSSLWRWFAAVLAVVLVGCLAAGAALTALFFVRGYMLDALLYLAWAAFGLGVACAMALAAGWILERRG